MGDDSMDRTAEHQQFVRNRDDLNTKIADLVKAITDVGEAKIKAEDHARDQDAFDHARNHRRVAEDGARAFNAAVNAYIKMRRGPQPEPESPKCLHQLTLPHEYQDAEGRMRGCPGPQTT